MQDLKDWLIRLLGGFTLHEMQTKDLEIEKRIQDLAEAHKLYMELNLETASLHARLEEPAREMPEPLALSPMPWTRMRRQFEKMDAEKVRNAKT